MLEANSLWNSFSISDVFGMSVINFYFREKGKAFSIEKIFEELAESVESSSITVRRLYCPFPGGRNLLNVIRNGLWARRNATELNHITGDAHYLALFLPENSCVLTIHDCDMLAPLSGFKRWLVWLIWLYLPVRAAETIIVISERTKEELCRITKISGSRVQVIPDFVSDSFEFVPKPAFPEEPRVLVLGTKLNKNISRIVEALSGLSVELRIIGKLSTEQEQLLVESNLKWSNAYQLSDNDIRLEYELCDFVLFPSLTEGFGMPIVEAQATGRPIITSNVSPMKEVAGSGALLVDPESVTSIRAGVSKLLVDSSIRTRLIEQGRINVEQFRLGHVSEQYQHVYKRV